MTVIGKDSSLALNLMGNINSTLEKVSGLILILNTLKQKEGLILQVSKMDLI